MSRWLRRLTPGSAFSAGIASGIALAVLGAAVVASLFPLTSVGGSHFEVTEVTLAPGGLRRAVLYTGMGGGAAGWCNQRLLIEPTVGLVPTPAGLEALPFDSVLFTASCGSKIQLEWLGSADLEVRYTLDMTGVSTFQRPATPDSAVRLRYVAATP